jgi:predicted pyridoxine 5'-phosphate oxidase superfamily flavin-nucleotide-binding protein
MYHEGNRALQDRFDTRRLADRLEQVTVHDRFTPDDRAFIEGLDLFFLATADASGQPTCSYKGGDPGLVRVLDDVTLAFPNYDGNGMYLSLGNTQVNPKVGLLFIDFMDQRRMRVDGEATLSTDAGLMSRWPGAQFVVVVHATRIFPNCPRYIHRFAPVERSVYVPAADHVPPVPDWKRSAWACDVLPAGDPARGAPPSG